jgi:hypothetical protein
MKQMCRTPEYLHAGCQGFDDQAFFGNGCSRSAAGYERHFKSAFPFSGIAVSFVEPVDQRCLLNPPGFLRLVFSSSIDSILTIEQE